MDPTEDDPLDLGLDAGTLIGLAEMLRFGLLIRGPSGRIVGTSPAMARMSGYTLDELRSIDDPTLLFDAESRDAARAWMDEDPSTSGHQPTFRGRVRHKSGEPRTIELAQLRCDVRGAEHTVIAMQRIDDRLALERRQQVLGQALEATPVAVVIFRIADGAEVQSMEIVASNAAADEFAGVQFQPGQQAGRLLGDADDDPIGVIGRAVERVADGGIYVEERAPFPRQSGDATRVRCSVTKVGRGTYGIFMEDISDQHEAELERRELLERVLAAGDDERRRIADGLHDDIIQRLAAAALFIESAQQHADEHAAPRLSEAGQALRSTIGGLRRLIFELAPPELEDHGLEAAVRMVAEHLFAGTDTELLVECQGSVDDAEPRAVTICYRLAAEALTNARKHARARSVRTALGYDGSVLTGVVTDDGLGIDTDPDQGGHLGMRTMQERAELLGGRLEVGTGSHERGTSVSWRLPAPPVPGPPRAAALYRDWRPPGPVRESLPKDLSFEALVEGTPDIISCFDRSLRHLYVNPAVEAATGIPRASFIGRTNRDLGMPAGARRPVGLGGAERLRQCHPSGAGVRVPLTSGAAATSCATGAGAGRRARRQRVGRRTRRHLAPEPGLTLTAGGCGGPRPRSDGRGSSDRPPQLARTAGGAPTAPAPRRHRRPPVPVPLTSTLCPVRSRRSNPSTSKQTDGLRSSPRSLLPGSVRKTIDRSCTTKFTG